MAPKWHHFLKKMFTRSLIKKIVESTDTVSGKSFDILIQCLIIYSLITFSIETLPDLQSSTKKYLQLSEFCVVMLFTLEYLLRVVVADNKRKFVFSFYGIIDLLAILPFYLAIGIDLRAIRAFRLFRLIHLMKLARYSRAVQRFRKALEISREEIVLFAGFTVILLYLSAVGIYYFERNAQPEAFKSVFHSMWWAVATLTTVGYGDVYPITTGGKIFTFLILILGLGIVAVPSGLLASSLSKVKSSEIG